MIGFVDFRCSCISKKEFWRVKIGAVIDGVYCHSETAGVGGDKWGCQTWPIVVLSPADIELPMEFTILLSILNL